MKLARHIPNFITSCNLACGCLGIVMAFEGNLQYAAYLIFLGMLFDFFDGMAARLLKVSSPIGKELDSLADLVSFGVLPAVLIYQMLTVEQPLSFIAFLVVIFSALRLAKFNTDENQDVDFIGLPTPANALFLSALVFVKDDAEYSGFLSDPILITITVILSLLLVSPIKLFSLKVKSFGWRGNEFQVILLLLALVLVAVLGLIGLPFIIIAYIALSIVKSQLSNRKQ